MKSANALSKPPPRPLASEAFTIPLQLKHGEVVTRFTDKSQDCDFKALSFYLNTVCCSAFIK
jgi:hypothetical protein